jgi:hypothetical protein
MPRSVSETKERKIESSSKNCLDTLSYRGIYITPFTPVKKKHVFLKLHKKVVGLIYKPEPWQRKACERVSRSGKIAYDRGMFTTRKLILYQRPKKTGVRSLEIRQRWFERDPEHEFIQRGVFVVR